MPVAESELTQALVPSLTNGTFPSSEDVLTSELSSAAIPSLLEIVTLEKRGLEDDVRAISRDQSSNVDGWIVQAKKVQEDIARCKIEAAEIVKEHEQIRHLRASAHDAQSKVNLLRGEIEFTTSLQHELESIGLIKGQLNDLQLNDPILAAPKLQAVSVSSLRSENARHILEDRQNQMRHQIHLDLEARLDKVIAFGRGNQNTWIEIASEGQHNLDNILKAMQHIGTLQRASEKIADNIATFITKPLVQDHPLSAEIDAGKIVVKFSISPTEELLLDVIRSTVKYLHTQLPDLIVGSIATQVIPPMVKALINNHLSSAIPTDLTNIVNIQHLKESVYLLANDLKSYQWPSYQELLEWVEQMPHLWLRTRKMDSLNAIKVALSGKRGPNYQVERRERQIISKQEAAFVSNGGADEWDADWGNEDAELPAGQQADEEEDTSGWGFDDEKDKTQNEDEAADAWGWDDDGPGGDSKPPSPKMERKKQTVNGANGGSPAEREVTLAENYTVTDIPDHVVQILGRDLLDAQEVLDPKYSVLHSASPSSGLLALPTHVLAMFRAVTPDYYTGQLDSPSGNMHLYNDSLYIVQKLRENFSSTTSTDYSSTAASFEPDCQVMERFARSAYAKEMDLQRTILGDILDGAQGFSNCTQPPFAVQCETAVTSAIERIRAMHAQWRDILSHSALLQSVGSLLSTVINKMVTDILDMEDISEPESQRLTNFCAQVSTLSDLFLAEKPARDPVTDPTVATTDGEKEKEEREEEESEAVPLTAVYVPHWLRFQYLANILESSLVDIRFLWTEGELSMEFNAEEVVDLIRALFAESTHRRQAIAEIRS